MQGGGYLEYAMIVKENLLFWTSYSGLLSYYYIIPKEENGDGTAVMTPTVPVFYFLLSSYLHLRTG